MRLVTRADFDGLCCAALLKEVGLIDEFKFVHPKDVQDGLVDVNSNDVLANIPYIEGAGMWFDHHVSEGARIKEEELSLNNVKGAVKSAPSCARVIWNYYGGHQKFDSRFDAMMEAVDKVDSADLTLDEILKPQGWVLLGFIMDPRTGLGRYQDFRIGNWELLTDLIDYCRTKNIEEILALPDVKERIEFYTKEEESFKEMLKERSSARENVVVTDLRDTESIRVGNRFLVYALFPDCKVSIQMMWDHLKENVVVTVGYNVLNPGCKINIGMLLLEYGGGGHDKVGTCQIYAPMAEKVVDEIVDRINEEC